jgi:two-component system CheB/CheR fusion protein
MPAQRNQDFEKLLDYIKRERGFDFTGYKRPSLVRRVEKRMQEVDCPTYADYLGLLEAQPREYAELFDTILINVTSFFREPATWQYVQEEIAPRVLEAKGITDLVRVWSTGCASGEEAYTAAIVLAEVMGEEAFTDRVKIYATDVDEDALASARRAIYKTEKLEPIPEPLRARYFEPAEDGRNLVKPDIRRAVIFGRHDLVQDPPISRIDLLIARNTLIYFSASTQEAILKNFHFSLNGSGFLLLGRSEVVSGRSSLFDPVDLKNRVFAPVERGGDFRTRLLTLVHDDDEQEESPAHLTERLRETGFELSPVAQLVVQNDGRLAFANAKARHLCGLSTRDLRRPFADLEVSYRPVELRSVIDRAHEERRPVTLEEVPWPIGNEERFYDVQVMPMLGVHGVVGTSITFGDVTHSKHVNQMAKAAQDQLAAALEQTQSSAEELETTNEELQSTNEELETTNEELQSTNEELETMNEELQATNEELATLNEELRRRSSDLDRSNELMESVLGEIEVAVVVVDRDLDVEAWSERAEDLWGLSAEKAVGKHLLELEIGFPLEELREPVLRCLTDSSGHEVTADVVSRLGNPIRVRVSCAPLLDGDGARGAILVMEEVKRETSS